MGLKQEARSAMDQAGVPILPGSKGVLSSVEEALDVANGIGYPIMMKASAGGGGRGMRVVRNAEELPHLMAQAQAEAAAAFSNGDMYMEKLVENPRHIEFQILADNHGNVEVLGERECSIQRRHQKLIEESPSVAVNPGIAQAHIGIAAGGAQGHRLHQRGHGGIPDGRRRQPVLHRGQCPHPGGAPGHGNGDRHRSGEEPDPHRRASLGEILPFPPGKFIELRGHALECRINAEHPETLTPSPGRITGLNLPGGVGVRVDTAAYQDGVIPPYYDSLVAKLITFGANRAEAIARMRRALDMFVVEGIYTSIPLHQKILAHPDFIAGKIDTGFLGRSGLLPEKK